ncbi:MAG: B12-binding domain-containing radical SAM protein [Mahellales bacterium]|jgi:radical SAM superfamily enzyme YgiQ (UPF0313 family)
MKVLLVYPKCPNTFWSFKYALDFISKKASFPPLGILTVAAMLPKDWEMKLVDMNVKALKDEDIKWADYVFISAMLVQRESVKKVVQNCRRLGVKTVAGGPLFTTDYEDFPEIDHLILNEAEVTLPRFLEDLEKGQCKRIYTSEEWADIKNTPVPLWSLIDMKDYTSMNIQYSRGCPYNCEFCDIITLYGRKPRIKDRDQIINELEVLYDYGWRGQVFFVDDNFIGNKSKLKQELLPYLIEWMEDRNYPFIFSTEASVDLSDDDQLLSLMRKARFSTVFMGIETPNEESLTECSKVQNKNRDLVKCVEKIRKYGMHVQGGFIVGFDSDPVSIFERLINFIQESGIVVAMVGLLNAPRGTRLYDRLAKEGRLLKNMSGDNTDFTMNFIPKMDYKELIRGYKRLIDTIYSPDKYYERVTRFLKDYTPHKLKAYHFKLSYLAAFFKSVIFIGAIGKERLYYWRLFFWSLFRRPRLLPFAIMFSIYGFHFRKVFENYSWNKQILEYNVNNLGDILSREST